MPRTMRKFNIKLRLCPSFFDPVVLPILSAITKKNFLVLSQFVFSFDGTVLNFTQNKMN